MSDVTISKELLMQIYAALNDAHFTVEHKQDSCQRIKLMKQLFDIINSQPTTYVWECNECGSQEYTMTINEDDVHRLNCGSCGSSELHKAVTND